MVYLFMYRVWSLKQVNTLLVLDIISTAFSFRKGCPSNKINEPIFLTKFFSIILPTASRFLKVCSNLDIPTAALYFLRTD